MTAFDPQQLGRHDEALRQLDRRLGGVEDYMADMSGKLDQVLLVLAEKKGERRATAWIAGSISTVIGIVIAIVQRLVEHK